MLIVAVAVAAPPVIVTVGTVVYVVPLFSIKISVTTPASIIATAVAVVPPPPGASIVTAGAELYPLPPFVIVKPVTTPPPVSLTLLLPFPLIIS